MAVRAVQIGTYSTSKLTDEIQFNCRQQKTCQLRKHTIDYGVTALLNIQYRPEKRWSVRENRKPFLKKKRPYVVFIKKTFQLDIIYTKNGSSDHLPDSDCCSDSPQDRFLLSFYDEMSPCLLRSFSVRWCPPMK